MNIYWPAITIANVYIAALAITEGDTPVLWAMAGVWLVFALVAYVAQTDDS